MEKWYIIISIVIFIITCISCRSFIRKRNKTRQKAVAILKEANAIKTKIQYGDGK